MGSWIQLMKPARGYIAFFRDIGWWGFWAGILTGAAVGLWVWVFLTIARGEG